jgi:DNA segregation ATPase FtsK/SpoIIIE, S-DNA-T family
MKICPNCNQTYKDDDINFCLSDGTTLIKKGSGKARKHSRYNEIAALIMLAVSILIFLSLVTHSYEDPVPWLQTGGSGKIHNWIGVLGALISASVFAAIGSSAYIFPAILALMAWRVFYAEGLRPRISRVIGFVLLVVTASSLIDLFGWGGGTVGTFFFHFLKSLLGTIGSGILLAALFAAAILLVTDVSFFGFFGNFEMAWANFRVHYDEWAAKRREGREDYVSKAHERLEKRRDIRLGKTGKEPPTISMGDGALNDLKTQVASADAKTKIGTGRLTTAMESGELLELPGPAIPTISASEQPVEEPESSSLPESGELLDLVSADMDIPISPVKHTGDLNGHTLDGLDEDIEEEEDLPVLPKKAQSYEDYVLPGSQFLTQQPPRIEQKDEELLAIAQELSEKTKEFNVTGRVVHICQGPVVTTYEFKPDPGVKYSRVTGLVDDLCLALKAESIRIDRIPGKAFVGIEVPNRQRETIHLREVIESKKFKESDSLLSIALGKTIDGLNFVADLAKMPHLLIAGATGAGKSVGVNTLIVSILYKARPDEVKFIMVDPKRLELGVYADIPHLATPIITDPKRAAISLRWAVSEMERRYKDLAGWGVRNIDGFNLEVKRRNGLGMVDDATGEKFNPLPYIVIIIDELADLMMVSGKEVEESITRLAQMARAVGIHLVLATQRPSVDVITGLIKANFPSRISFRVSSKVDSRTIIDANGAESLLGRGDMLFLPPASSQVIRIHGGFVDEKEIFKIVEHIKAQGNPDYDTTITKSEEELDESGDLPGKKDPLFWDAVKSVVAAKRASTSLLQRHLRIGYGRAAAILDAMVREGYIGDMDGSSRARPVLQKAYEDLQDVEEMSSY